VGATPVAEASERTTPVAEALPKAAGLPELESEREGDGILDALSEASVAEIERAISLYQKKLSLLHSAREVKRAEAAAEASAMDEPWQEEPERVSPTQPQPPPPAVTKRPRRKTGASALAGLCGDFDELAPSPHPRPPSRR
jgi:hypothetical protein